ncbi:MAG: diguanylate cyclase [Nitrospirae bacterium]|nr:diguanylate cyclase [Nitrospirota bacterium]
MRILVADDDESLRSVLKQVLSMDGYEVTLTASGEEALAAFKKEPFPLIITDIRMGNMSGITLLQEVKRLSPDTQVIIITSNATLDTAISAIQAGAYDYLAKPFDDIALISSVARRTVEKIRLIEENKSLLEKLKRKNEELEFINMTLKELTIRDGLTGLYNHRHFQETLAAEILRSKRYPTTFSLVFLDVDYFKQYNDTHGHLHGDAVLVALSKLLISGIRQSDIAVRYGGEEFVLLLPETSKVKAFVLAGSIREKIAAHPFPGRETQPQGKVTVSMGIAAFPEDGSDSSTLLHHADEALYQAKNGGRNRVC